MVELVDIYNEQKQKTGRMIDKYGPFDNGEYYLTTHIWIKHKDLWLIQKRSHNCKNNPDKWSVTGGAVKSGETSLQAATRELFEELQVTIWPEQLKFSGCYKQKYAFVDVYFVELTDSSLNINFNKTEVSDLKWCSKEEIDAKYQSGEFVHSVYFGLMITLYNGVNTFPYIR